MFFINSLYCKSSTIKDSVVKPACCQIETNSAHPSQESCRINNNLTKTQQEHLAGRPVNLFCCASFCDGIPRSEREGVRE